MLPDDVIDDAELGAAVIMVHQDAAGQGTTDGNGRNAGLVDPADQFIPDGLVDNLVSQDHGAVEFVQIRQGEDPVFALVLGVSQVLAETVEDAQENVPVRIGILLQPMKRLVDQLIVPVDCEKCDPVRSACL